MIFAVGCFFAPDQSSSWRILFRKIPLLILPISFILLDKKEFQGFNSFLFLFLGGCIACSLLCFGNAMISIIENHSFENLAGDRQGDYYYYSYRMLAMPSGIDPILLSFYFNFALIVALQTPFLKNVILRCIVVTYLSVFILLLASKIGIVIFGCVLTAWILLSVPTRKMSLILLTFLIPLLVVIVTAFPFLSERFRPSTDFDYREPDSAQWTSSTFRLAIWSCAVDGVKKKPVWGYGTGGGQNALEKIYSERGFVRGQLDHFNAQNEYLNTALDIGLPGVAALLFMLVLSFRSALNARNTATICFLIIMTLGFCVETVLLRQKGIVFFSFFYSFLFWQLTPKA
jgi:O-antigen ligase